MNSKTENYWQKGQTIIETVFMLIILLMLFFGIAEISRAWWLKNQLNNAARIGVRVAVVDSNLTLSGISPTDCIQSGNDCTHSINIIEQACASITASNLCRSENGTSARVEVSVTQVDTSKTIIVAGDEVKVKTTGEFVSLFPNLLNNIRLFFSQSSGSVTILPPTIILTAESIMRYE